VDTLKTKVEIARAFWALTYVTAVLGAQVLRLVKAGDVGEDPEVVGEYLLCACGASLDAPVIRGLAGQWGVGHQKRRPRVVTPPWSISWPASSARGSLWVV
jgi:hypothetical protein